MKGGAENESEREHAQEKNGGTNPPAAAGGVSDKKIGKPHGDLRGAQIQKDSESEEIQHQREKPIAGFEDAFGDDDEKREKKIGDDEDEGTGAGLGAGPFEEREQRQQNNRWTREGYVPLKRAAIGRVEAHARGRSSYWLSLTSRT